MASRPLLLAALALAVVTVPSASAEPVCIQAYPWSEVCSAVGDVVGDMVPPGEGCLPDPLAACQLPIDHEPVCVQALPWSLVCDLHDRVAALVGR